MVVNLYETVSFFKRYKNKKVSVITKVSDELWYIISDLLPHEKPKNTVGCPAIPFKKDTISNIMKHYLKLYEKIYRNVKVYSVLWC